MKIAVCTIVSKNHFHFTKTLMNSLQKFHPDWDRHVLLTDEVENSNNNFKVTLASDLNLPEFKKFAFRYTALEFSCAVKPHIIKHLFKSEYDAVIYFDSDICIYRPLNEIIDLLNNYFMILTPHITHSLNDGKNPSDIGILRAGVYNLGFIALSRHKKDLGKFLDWWSDKLEYECIEDHRSNHMVDQRWMDLAPSIFEDVYIFKNENYNVAYWNLLHRNIDNLAFFHFSGFDPMISSDDRRSFSKHQDRFELKNLSPKIIKLVENYRHELMENGAATYSKLEYTWDKFSNGETIDEENRIIYRNNLKMQKNMGEDPFSHPECCTNTLLDTPLNHIGFWEEEARLINSCWFKDYFSIKIPHGNELEIEGYNDHFPNEKLSIDLLIDNNLVKKDLVLPNGHFILKTNITNINSGEFRTLTVKPNKYFTPLERGINNDARKLSFRIYKINLNKKSIIDFSKLNPYRLKKNKELSVNLIGYAQAHHSLGQSIRYCANTMSKTEIPYGIYNLTDLSKRGFDNTFKSNFTSKTPYYFNLIHLNGNDSNLQKMLPNLTGHYNIGYWHWELAEPPESWFNNLLINEIWMSSQFMLKCIGFNSTLPTVCIPHPIDFTIKGYSKEYFGLPKDKFLFLIMYDMFSVQERKNPFAAIKAFKKAFGDSKDVVLVVKTFGNDETLKEKLAELKSHLDPKTILINKILTCQEVYELENLCDCYVSLHKAEGFGLNIAESMFLGKPTIATNWSGNIDFMNSKNSCLVDYELVELKETYGIYPKGCHWAEADVDHAAYYMQKIYNDVNFRTKIGQEAKKYIIENNSPKVIGEMYKKRLTTILNKI